MAVIPQRCGCDNRSQFVPLTEVTDLWVCLREYNAEVGYFVGAVHRLLVWPYKLKGEIAQLRLDGWRDGEVDE